MLTSSQPSTLIRYMKDWGNPETVRKTSLVAKFSLEGLMETVDLSIQVHWRRGLCSQ